MKYNVSVTKRIILTAVIFIVGVIFLTVGLSSYYKYYHALNLETLDEQMLKEGKYITGNIDTYIGGIMYRTSQYYDISQTHLTTWKTYDYYTVPIEDNSYITLLISDESVKEQLDAFENGHGEKVHFEGIIIEPSSELNYELSENVGDFNPENLVNSFVIKEANLINRNAIVWGIILLLLAIFLFFASGGSNSVVEVETDRTDYSLYVNLSDKVDKL